MLKTENSRLAKVILKLARNSVAAFYAFCLNHQNDYCTLACAQNQSRWQPWNDATITFCCSSLMLRLDHKGLWNDWLYFLTLLSKYKSRIFFSTWGNRSLQPCSSQNFAIWSKKFSLTLVSAYRGKEERSCLHHWQRWSIHYKTFMWFEFRHQIKSAHKLNRHLDTVYKTTEQYRPFTRIIIPLPQVHLASGHEA